MFIRPLKSFDKTLETAPDKSITHRAVMFNAAAEGRRSAAAAFQKCGGQKSIFSERLFVLQKNGGRNDFRSARRALCAMRHLK